MEDSLIHLPCPEEIYIQAFKRKKRINKSVGNNRYKNDSDSLISHKLLSNTNTTNITNIISHNTPNLEQSLTSSPIYDESNDECTISDIEKIENNDFCHIRVRDKDNVVHLTNLNASKWNKHRICNVLLQINPYWNDKNINIYILQHYKTGLLTASIEFKSRDYSEKAMELIESNFNLFVNGSNITNTSNISMMINDNNNKTILNPINYVKGIKLKLIKPNINTNHVFQCYGQTAIPLGFDLKSIISNYYHLHCTVQTKLEYYQNTKLFNDIPTTKDIDKFLNNSKYPPIFNNNNNNKNKPTISKKLILSIYFPFITLCIIHENKKYYFYICGRILSLYQFEKIQNKYIPIITRSISPSSLSSLLYIDILTLIDKTGYYTFYDSFNNNFECDLYKTIGTDLNENDINPYNLKTLKLPTNDNELDRCVICLNKINQYEFTRISSCKHLFHYNCIKQLLQFNNNLNQQIWDNQLNQYIICNYAQCPLCRRKFTSIQSRIAMKEHQERPTVQFINVTDIDLIIDDDDDDDDEETSSSSSDEEEEEEEEESSNYNDEADDEQEDEDEDEDDLNNMSIESEMADYNEYDEDDDDDDDEEDEDDDGAVDEEEGTETEGNEEDEDEYNEDANSYYESFDEE